MSQCIGFWHLIMNPPCANCPSSVRLISLGLLYIAIMFSPGFKRLLNSMVSFSAFLSENPEDFFQPCLASSAGNPFHWPAFDFILISLQRSKRHRNSMPLRWLKNLKIKPPPFFPFLASQKVVPDCFQPNPFFREDSANS